jgi:hypothetical protein
MDERVGIKRPSHVWFVQYTQQASLKRIGDVVGPSGTHEIRQASLAGCGPTPKAKFTSLLRVEKARRVFTNQHTYQPDIIYLVLRENPKRASRIKMSVSNLLANPDQADNYEEMEKQFAVKAVQQMTVYWSILEKMPGSKLRLTRMDDEIMDHLKKDFPDFDPAVPLNEDEMKSKEGKERWRNFCMVYEKGDKKIEDFNYGTMLRKDSKTEYGEDTTIFAVRMQFYAVEIARNRAGLNDWVYEKAQSATKETTTSS